MIANTNETYDILNNIIKLQMPGTVFIQGPSMSGKTEAVKMLREFHPQIDISIFTTEALANFIVKHCEKYNRKFPLYKNEIFSSTEIFIVEDFDLLSNKECTLLSLFQAIRFNPDVRFIFTGINLTERMSGFIAALDKVIILNTERNKPNDFD